MNKLYEKSEIKFAIILIIIYVIGESIAENISSYIGIKSIITSVFNLIFSIFILTWIKKNKLLKKYGLCKTSVPSKKFLWYIPLIIITSFNLWNGIAKNMPIPDTICHIISMLCVGFLEELIFRGFLFKAMSKDNVKTAIIVSSITFGLGHIINLLNGSGMSIITNLCQVFGAIAIGFLFVTIFYRSGTLIPCIISHSIININSTFSSNVGLTDTRYIIINLINLIITVLYTIILSKTLPKKEI